MNLKNKIIVLKRTGIKIYKKSTVSGLYNIKFGGFFNEITD